MISQLVFVVDPRFDCTQTHRRTARVFGKCQATSRLSSAATRYRLVFWFWAETNEAVQRAEIASPGDEEVVRSAAPVGSRKPMTAVDPTAATQGSTGPCVQQPLRGCQRACAWQYPAAAIAALLPLVGLTCTSPCESVAVDACPSGCDSIPVDLSRD